MTDPAAAQAYRILENLIVTLKLAPSAATNEKALIAATGLGRTPVREAVLRLAWEGLLEVRPRSGLRVASLRPADWTRVTEARRGLEVLLARGAARNAKPEHKESLTQALHAMRAALSKGDAEAFLQADKALDEAVGGVADNAYAARLVSPLQAHSRRFWFRFRAKEDLATAVAHHVHLIDAVVANDEALAAINAGKLVDLLGSYAANVAAMSHEKADR